MAKKRNDGLYQKNIVVGRKPDGSYIRKAVYGKAQKELDDKVLELKSQVKLGILVNEDATFSEMADVWEKYYDFNQNSTYRKTQRARLKQHIEPEIGQRSVKALKKIDLQMLLSDLSDRGYSTSSMKKLKWSACQVMEVATDKGLIVKNPFRNAVVVEKAPNDRRALTEEEISLVTNTWEGHRMGHCALILLYCGIRRGELIALNWSDFDFEEKILHITRSVAFTGNQPTIKGPKSKAGVREVPVPDFLVDILKSLKKRSEIVCPTVEGKRMSSIAWRRAWESYEYYLNLQAGGKAACGGKKKVIVLDQITAHMFRHTYASLLYEAVVDVKSAQLYLGHSDVETTLKVYTHLTKEKSATAVKSINDHFGEKVKKITSSTKSLEKTD